MVFGCDFVVAHDMWRLAPAAHGTAEVVTCDLVACRKIMVTKIIFRNRILAYESTELV